MILIRKGDFSLKRRPKGDQKWSKSLLRRPWSPKGDLIGNAVAIDFKTVVIYTQWQCGHQMYNQSENCRYGRKLNPRSSAIATAALTTELQTHTHEMTKLPYTKVSLL